MFLLLKVFDYDAQIMIYTKIKKENNLKQYFNLHHFTMV